MYLTLPSMEHSALSKATDSFKSQNSFHLNAENTYTDIETKSEGRTYTPHSQSDDKIPVLPW